MNGKSVSHGPHPWWPRLAALALAMLCLLPAVSVLAAAPPDSVDRAAAYRAALPLYQYDRKKPLAVRAVTTSSTDSVRVTRFSYSGANGDRVPALLALPAKTAGAHAAPCLILLHGLGGSKDSLLPLAIYAAKRGYAALAIDEYGQGARAASGGQAGSEGLQGMLASGLRQTVIDVRRGLDYLATRREIDRKRIGLIGLSMGGIVGGIAAGVDTRIKAAALISGGGDLALIIKALADRDATIGGQSMSAYKTVDWTFLRGFLAAEDPLTFAAHIAPRALLMIHGRRDTIVAPAAAEALYTAAHAAPRADATIHWYPDAGHIPPFDKVLPDVMEWLAKKL
jgi:dienelactone hydrolase